MPSDVLDRGATAAHESAPHRQPLICFLAEEKTEAALQGALAEMPAGAEFRRGTVLHAIKHLSRTPTPAVLVVDIAGIADPLEALERLAHVCTPDVKVVVIGENPDIAFYRTLVRELGVTEYLHKPVTRDAVMQVLLPHIAGTEAGASEMHGGKVVTVSGARGGVGATTIAANLAVLLAAQTHGHVVLLDLHLQRGNTALLLGAKTDAGLRIALEQPDRADALFLDRVAVPVGERLRLIAAETPFDVVPTPTVEGVAQVLELLRRRFNYVIVDMPAPGPAAMRGVLAAARHRLVVMHPDLASVRDADRLHRWFATLAGGNRSTLVVNRANMFGALKPALLEQGLSHRPDISLPDFGKALIQAANLGTPGVEVVSGLARALAPLCAEITGQPAAQGAAQSSLARFFVRS